MIMKKMIFIFVMFFSILFFAGFAFAAAEKWEIDKNHSHVYFDIRHTYATVRGQFEEFSAELQFDPDNLQMGRVSFEVGTKSINTGISRRDNHLRSEEFFNVNEYSSMTFQSTGVKPMGGNQYMLEGSLTIKGKTQNVSLPMTFFGARENPLKQGQMVAGFETRFSIDRLDYGVGTGKFFQMGVVGRKVDILISLEVLKNK
jgi:polyisoprenoid-binding protein YceI